LDPALVDTFEKNLALLAISNPSLALKLKDFPEALPHYLDEGFIEGCESDVLYIYGLKNGSSYADLQGWLQEDINRSLIYLEDDLTHLRYFIQNPSSVSLLKDPQVEIVDVTHPEQAIRHVTQENILRSFTVFAVPAYAHSKTFALIKDLIAFESAEQNIRNQELAQFGVLYFNNFYRNLLQLPLATLGNSLEGKFKDIPAIICGAGPSLTRHVPFLREYMQNALLFAPGSALNILTYHGVWPHFGVNVDPTPETFHRQIMNRGYETPIFYRGRLYFEALTAIHGPRLFLSGAVFYKVARWFEEQLNLPSLQLEGGYNVVHTTLEIARLLGCNPIIFTGLDLCYNPGEHYSEGVERSPLFPQVDKKSHLGETIAVKNRKGEERLSHWPWIAEAQWVDRYAREHPDLKILNASEGIQLFSIPSIDIRELPSLLPQNTFQLKQKAMEAIQSAGRLPIRSENIQKALQTFYASMKACEAGLLSNQLLKDEPAFEYVLEQFDAFFMQFAGKDFRNAKRIQDPASQKERVRNLEKERMQFLIQTARVNLKIMENALQLPLLEADRENESHAEENKEGAVLYYYPNRQLKTELHFANGQLHGPVRLFYPSGQSKRELNFQNGKREGVERSWYENGQLFTEIDYSENKAHGARCWFPDGRLAKDIQAKDIFKI
jgi:hypothetical protein